MGDWLLTRSDIMGTNVGQQPAIYLLQMREGGMHKAKIHKTYR